VTVVDRAPAGLLVRSSAFALDYIGIAAYLVVLVASGVVMGQVAPSAVRILFGGPLSGQASGFLLITLPVALYFAVSEASERQSTWGKRRMGLIVTDLSGGRISLARSLSRTVMKFIPWELAHLCIWQISFARDQSSPVYVVGFTLVWIAVGANIVSLWLSPSCQTIYDRIAGTRVVRGSMA